MNHIRNLTVTEADVMSLPKINMQSKICYPGHFKDSEFASLGDAVRQLKKSGDLRNHMSELIKYNICYRDYLREYGMEILLRLMVSHAPELARDFELLQRLWDWYDKEGRNLSEYDIQCYNINDTITVLGHKFNGLEDVKAHRNACGRYDYSKIYFSECTPKKNIPDVYVCEFYQAYPTFDESDRACENRTFQNYMFTSESIDEDKLKRIFDMGYGSNCRMVREGVPAEMLPLLYYEGEGNYMLLAQNK